MTRAAKQHYDLYVNTQQTGVIKAAEAVLIESSGQLTRMGFRYTEAYREHPHAFALDPVQLPLSSNETEFHCAGGVPGILDDYLPDAWGRKVLAMLSFYREQRKLDRHSAIDVLSQLSNSRIGALQWVIAGKDPDYGLGCDIQFIERAETAAQSVDNPESISEHIDEVSLLYLASAGTGIGGARPKALLYLLRMMLFNRAINNTDDHERNFSLIYDDGGYCMAPAYDIVPSLINGAYPVAGYQYSPSPPRPSEAASKGKIFGLPKTLVKRIADEVINSVEQWPDWAQQYDVSDRDINSVSKVLQM